MRGMLGVQWTCSLGRWWVLQGIEEVTDSCLEAAIGSKEGPDPTSRHCPYFGIGVRWVRPLLLEGARDSNDQGEVQG